MGYTTTFKGVLKFKNEVNGAQLRELAKILGSDIRGKVSGCYTIDFQIAKDFSGIEWDGSEKFYGAEKCVQYILDTMRDLFPDFGLTGELFAQGEKYEDRWRLVIDEQGNAQKVEVAMTGRKVQCPHCERYFYVDDEQKPAPPQSPPYAPGTRYGLVKRSNLP